MRSRYNYAAYPTYGSGGGVAAATSGVPAPAASTPGSGSGHRRGSASASWATAAQPSRLPVHKSRVKRAGSASRIDAAAATAPAGTVSSAAAAAASGPSSHSSSRRHGSDGSRRRRGHRSSSTSTPSGSRTHGHHHSSRASSQPATPTEVQAATYPRAHRRRDDSAPRGSGAAAAAAATSAARGPAASTAAPARHASSGYAYPGPTPTASAGHGFDAGYATHRHTAASSSRDATRYSTRYSNYDEYEYDASGRYGYSHGRTAADYSTGYSASHATYDPHAAQPTRSCGHYGGYAAAPAPAPAPASSHYYSTATPCASTAAASLPHATSRRLRSTSHRSGTTSTAASYAAADTVPSAAFGGSDADDLAAMRESYQAERDAIYKSRSKSSSGSGKATHDSYSRRASADDSDSGMPPTSASSKSMSSVSSASTLPRSRPKGPPPPVKRVSDLAAAGAGAGGYDSLPASPMASAADLPGMDPCPSSPRGLVGLMNLGNTCFMASCLQCLSNVPQLTSFFYTGRYRKDLSKKSPTRGKVAQAYGGLIQRMWRKGASGAERPSEVKAVVGKVAARFVGYDQQDAQEFLRFFLDALHDDTNRVQNKTYEELTEKPSDSDAKVSRKWWDYYCKRNDSVIKELFAGQLKSSLTCPRCKFVSRCFDPFWDLSVPIPKSAQARDRRSHGGACTVEDCLQAYITPEVLRGTDAWHCPKCKKDVEARKEMSLFRCPNVLVIHLKRFSYSMFRRTKLTTSVRFPVQGLNLLKFCADESPEHSSRLPPVYDLVGVSNHMGGLGGGHYTADCINVDDQQWHNFNDARVSSSSPTRLNESAAYLLFFQRRPAV